MKLCFVRADFNAVSIALMSECRLCVIEVLVWRVVLST